MHEGARGADSVIYGTIAEQIRRGIESVIDEKGFESVDFAVDPARPGFGDLASNAPFLLAKKMRQNPRDISAMLAGMCDGRCGPFVKGARAHESGYLNFDLERPAVAKIILAESLSEDHGEPGIGREQSVAVEHTSVNPNKALHIGHVRNIVIGDCMARILRKAGFDVSVLNYVDDSGLQVADIVLGFEELGFSRDPGNMKFDRYCGDEVYVKTTAMYKKEPSLEERRGHILREMEEGTSETARIAGDLTRRVLACQLETCWKLGARYDCLNFESHILRSGLWDMVFSKLKEAGLVELEDSGKNAGCWVIRGKNEDDKVIVRSNGTATYIAKDIPYAAWKLGLVDDPFGYEVYEGQPDTTLQQTILSGEGLPGRGYAGTRIITVIDSRQARLQHIVRDLMDKFGTPGSYIHLGYESVTLSVQTAAGLGADTAGPAQMSGRRGLYVNADDVLRMLRGRAAAETARRNPGIIREKADDIADAVSVATIRYEMAKQDLDKQIVFDATKSMSLEGDTASYIQYAYARAMRLLEKAPQSTEVDYAQICEGRAWDLCVLIGAFGMRVADAANNFAPKVVARYCRELAVAFSAFYEHDRILDAEPAQTGARLRLVRASAVTLEAATGLLGMRAPARM